MSHPQPADDVRTLTNNELYAHLHAAVGRLLEHQKEGVGGRACLCDIDPWAGNTECPYRQEVARLHSEVADRPHVVILDVAGPIPGAASVKVPNGEVFIDPRNRDVILVQDIGGMQRHIRWKWANALTTGEVLVTVAIAARDQPDPAQVQKLAAMMADFGDANLVALARHLIASGVQLPDAS